jgi:dienelactone hydrolase
MTVRALSAALLLAGGSAIALGLPRTTRPEHEVTAQEVVYQVPGMGRVAVRTNVPYKKVDGRELRLDLYYPVDFQEGSLRPAVIFVNGVGGRPDASLKDWGIYRSWGRLVAASGWIGVTFESRGGGPAIDASPDIADLLRFVRSDGARLGIQADRVAAWMCSANVTSGLRVVMADAERPALRASVVYYGTSDPPSLRTDLPVFLVKAGRDDPRLNAGIDALAARAAAANTPWTVVYAPNSHHAFDALDETDESRRIVRETLGFLRDHLSPEPSPAAPPSLARRALSHWFANEYAEAAAAYGEYVKIHPDDEEAWLRLGISQAHGSANGSSAAASLEKARSLGADTPLDLYNLACGFALLGQPEKALDYLERAVSAGYGIRSRIADDEDLASLRSLERYQKVLSKAPER